MIHLRITLSEKEIIKPIKGFVRDFNLKSLMRPLIFYSKNQRMFQLNLIVLQLNYGWSIFAKVLGCVRFSYNNFSEPKEKGPKHKDFLNINLGKIDV
ncbi:hypothetical protein [Borrelia hermsii]|uniref:hypothetical protein n=1 Tax=Borrelia hermsii TaxID=140 RepID=UPI001F308F73|nr:hypothetical protein [Borrelia hermsii]